ncbi:hypothetical protein PC117_g19400 [Phytophthora cactorum]|uniref:Uncharacterized protein n=1 Tax=Phytophthora cactorum TaxID=29920 RepID=A0A8T1BXE2_9STRA|nr:hypothetical protein PC117_g19400 [Phytophthora cactorum]
MEDEWSYKESAGSLFAIALCKLESTNGEAITVLLSALKGTAMKSSPFGRLINARPPDVSYFYGTTWCEEEVYLWQLGLCGCVPGLSINDYITPAGLSAPGSDGRTLSKRPEWPECGENVLWHFKHHLYGYLMTMEAFEPEFPSVLVRSK